MSASPPIGVFVELFDTHFHCDSFEEPSEYVGAAQKKGVRFLLAAGSDCPDSIRCRDFCRSFENTWFAAGVHPHEAATADTDLERFHELAEDRRMAAVGEIGIDYYYMNSSREIQLEVFRKFLGFSLMKSLPAIVHCRDSREGGGAAYEDAFRLLSEFSRSGGRFVLHCYAGSTEWAAKFAGIGAYFGISGIVTFPKGSNIRETLHVIPADRLLLETDAPYLAPVPHRGAKNRSEYLIYTAEYVARELGTDIDKVASSTTANAFRLFRTGGCP
jgi:TatD DNase family protein